MKTFCLTLILILAATQLYAADSYELKWEYTTNVDSLVIVSAFGALGAGSDDYDGDGYADLVINSYGGNPTSGEVRIISGSDHKLLFSQIVSNRGNYISSVSPASDLDQDGDPEFIVGQYAVQNDNGDWSYTCTAAVHCGTHGEQEWLLDNVPTRSPLCINMVDFDRDGRNEFSIAYTTNNVLTVRVYGATGPARVGAGTPAVPQAISAKSFPNPFNADTFIEFTLPQAGAVQITLFDVTGRQIAVRRMDNLPAGVARTALSSLTPAQLPAGTYFVDIAQDNSGVTRQIVKLP